MSHVSIAYIVYLQQELNATSAQHIIVDSAVILPVDQVHSCFWYCPALCTYEVNGWADILLRDLPQC